MSDPTSKQDDGLEILFQAARSQPAEPDADFMARLAADAEAAAPPHEWRARSHKRSHGIIERMGGWLAATGLAATTAAGIWIGFAMPDIVNSIPIVGDTADSFALSEFLPAADLTALTVLEIDG